MSFTPQRMRLYTNPLPTSAEYAAFERMFENPSKAFFNISNEAKKQGGWDERTNEGTLFAILRGPYAGTYLFGRPRVKYTPAFETQMSPLGRSAGLVRWKQAQVRALLKDLPEVVFAQQAVDKGQTLEQALAEERERAQQVIKRDTGDIAKLERHLRQSPTAEKAMKAGGAEVGDIPELEDYEDIEDGWYVERTPAQIRARIAALKHRIEDLKAHPILSTKPGGAAYRQAEVIYVLSQAGGVDFDAVLAAIKEKPKRLRSIEDMYAIPRRREERARYARALLTTFSINDALKAQYPKVESVSAISVRGQPEPATVRYAFANWKSWLQRAEELGADAPRIYQVFQGVDPEEQMTPAQRRAADRKMGADAILHQAETFKYYKVPSSDFREVVKRFNLDEMRRITDTMMIAARPDVREALAETVEGRRIIQHIADKDWRAILRDHDRVAQVQTEIWNRGTYQETADDTALERFHSRAKAFEFPAGVRPLTTKDEFFAEGSEMGHCVGGYFYQRQSWCFAFLAPDGTRATLELGKNGTVKQFYGPRNTAPSPATTALLKEFLTLNADNTSRMSTGGFPPPDQTQAVVEHYPVPQQNPWRRRR